MRLTMEDYLKLAVPFVPPGLVSPEALRPVLALAGRLPPCASSGFECRLGEPTASADFLVNLLPTDGTRAAFAGRHPDARLPEAFLESPVWRRVRDFCLAWEDPDSPLHHEVRDAWLEFDAGEFEAPVPTPGVFFGHHPGQNARPDTLRRCLELLRGEERAEPPPALARCLEALPGTPRIEQVGMMFSRPTDDVRLCIRGVPPAGLSAGLRRAGWSGDGGELDALVEGLLPFVDEIILDVDVGEEVRPRLGLECILDRDPSPARWGRWLEHLVAQGLCTPDKRDALRAWPGLSSQRAQPESWPENLVRASQRMPGTQSGFARRLNHLKLVHQPGRPPEVKAYLAFRHVWFRLAPRESAA